MMARFAEVAFLTKVDKTNLNASGTEGNVTTLKKTHEIDGTERIYISGVSAKYAVKQYLGELGWKLSPVRVKTKRAQITTECDPEEYIDDDLFGYMDTDRDLKRAAPVKTSGMVSLFEYLGDLNRGVRFDPTETASHSLYDIEIVTTVFRSNWAVELDRVGVTDEKGQKKSKAVPDEEREKRVKALLESLFNMWSRVKQSNFLSKLGPEVLVLVFRNDKTLTIADKLKIDKEFNLDVKSLSEAIQYHQDKIVKVYVGYFASFLKNCEELKRLQTEYPEKLEVMSLADLKSKVLSDDFKLYS
jgi:CRISPR-associated protein Cst2